MIRCSLRCQKGFHKGEISMNSFLDIVALAGSVLSVVLLLLLMKRLRSESSGDSERILRDELRAGRGESPDDSLRKRFIKRSSRTTESTDPARATISRKLSILSSPL